MRSNVLKEKREYQRKGTSLERNHHGIATYFFSVASLPAALRRVISAADFGTPILLTVDFPTFWESQSCPVGIAKLGMVDCGGGYTSTAKGKIDLGKSCSGHVVQLTTQFSSIDHFCT